MNAPTLPPEPLSAEAIADVKRRAPTPRQQQYLDFIRRFIAAHGYPPTLREIGRELGIRSTNGVNDGLRALEKKGWIKRDIEKARGIVLVGGDDLPAPQAANELWRGENAKLRRLLVRARDALYRMPSLTPEAAMVAGDIREMLRRGAA